MLLDTKALAKATAAIVKQHVHDAISPLLKRIEDLEACQPVKGADGKDGASITLDDVAPVISAEVERAVASIPRPKDGADGKDGLDGANGADGKSASIEELETIIVGHVEKAVSAIPTPKDGQDGRDGLNGKDGASGKDGRDGKDGLGAASAIIDRTGHLILTMTDGSTKDLGPVVGKDGVNGRDGKDGTPGAAGEKGSDGIGFDDMDMAETDEGLKLRFARGEVVKEFLLPVPTDHGVWKEKLFRKGQGVTWGGSFWIAQRDTDKKPDTPDSGWRLAVKKGRDGKDGKSNG